jgi:membrane protein required for colicin V production
LNWLDIVLLLLIGASMIGGFTKGLTRMVVGLVAMVAALVFSLGFYRHAGALFESLGLSRHAAGLAGFLAIFVGIVMLGGLLGMLVKRVLKLVGLGFLDRLGGAALGALRGALAAIVIVMAIMSFTPKPPPLAVKDSRLAPYLLGASGLIVRFAPRELRDGYSKSWSKLERAWDDMKKQVERLPEEKF